MNREEFCQMLLNTRLEKKISLYAVQKNMGLTFQQAKRIEIGENNFNLNKAIDYLSSVDSWIQLRKNKKKYPILKYQDAIDWLMKSRDGVYSQRSLTQNIGLSNGAIRNIESGKSRMSIDIFLKLVDTFGFYIEIYTN